MKLPKTSIATTLLATALIATAFTGTAMAENGHRGHHSLAEQLDHIVDLTDAQETAIEKIEEKNRAAFVAQYGEPEHKKRKGKHDKPGMKEFLLLDPATPDYLVQVEQKANEHANRMKAATVSRAKTMQEAYALLTNEQKQELAEKRERIKQRIEKRAQKQD